MRIPVSKARTILSELVRRVRYGGEVIVLTDRGIDAAIILAPMKPADVPPKRKAARP